MREPLKPITLDPEHRWYFIRLNINDAFGRQMDNFDMATWDAELTLESALGRATSISYTEKILERV